MFEGYSEDFPYSRVTERLARNWPVWTKIRKDPNSIGQQFLNVFGLELQDVEDFLDEAQRNQYVGTANLGEIDWVYKVHLGKTIDPDAPLVLKAQLLDLSWVDLSECYSLMQFYSAAPDSHVAIIDYNLGILYTRQQYMRVSVNDSLYSSIVPHHVWNVFDEFALLLGLRRRYLETNAELKERTLDVFRFPGNATRIGLIRAIGRETGLVARETWPDEAAYFDTTTGNVTPETIVIEGQAIHSTQYEALPGGNYRVKPAFRAFYNRGDKYTLAGVRINSNGRLVLCDGERQGFMVTPVLNPVNLKYWDKLSFTGDALVDVMVYDYSKYASHSDAYLVQDLASGASIVIPGTTPENISEPIVLVVKLSRASFLDPSPEVGDLFVSYIPRESTVSYVHDVILNALHDDNFRQGLFEPDGHPSAKLKNYVSELNELVPIMWGRWKWDESYWDVVGKDLMGLHVLPNKWDPRLGEISNIYFQNGIGDDLDLQVKFDGDSWTPKIHSGFYYVNSSESSIVSANGEINTKYPSPEFVVVRDATGKVYKVVSVQGKTIRVSPVPDSGTSMVVDYASAFYLYASPKVYTNPGPTSQFVLQDGSASVFPLQGAPVLIEATDVDGNRVMLRQVAFLVDGTLSIVNKEVVTGNGTNVIHVDYDRPFDIAVPDGHTVQGTDGNKIIFAEDIPQGTSLEISYKVKDTFVVDMSEDATTVTLSGTYTNIEVHYESVDDTAYYTAAGPSLDPLSSHITSGFLYVVNQAAAVAGLEVSVHPDVIRANGIDSCIITVDRVDRLGNPAFGGDITHTVSLKTDGDNPVTISPAGTITKTGSYYNRDVFWYVSPDPSVIPDGSVPGRKKPCTATIVFACGSASQTVEVKVR